MSASQELRFKVIFVGDTNVGKSSLLMTATGQPFREEPVATIGADFHTKLISLPEHKVTVKLNFWDTQGQERFRTTSSSYHRGTHAVLVLYDIADRESFQNANMWYEDTSVHCKPEDTIFFFIGNKSDLHKGRKVTYAEGKELADHWHHPFFETSAKTLENVENVIKALCEALLAKHIRSLPQPSKPPKEVVVKEGKKFSIGNLFKRSKSSGNLLSSSK